MKLPSKEELEFFDEIKQPRPSHENHGVEDTFERPLSERLLSGHARNWRLVGNLLHCDTDFGPMVQAIPPDYICLGTNEKGLPILKKVVA